MRPLNLVLEEMQFGDTTLHEKDEDAFTKRTRLGAIRFGLSVKFAALGM
jgi:hypothetical protein